MSNRDHKGKFAPLAQQRLYNLLKEKGKANVYEMFYARTGEYFTGPARLCSMRLGALISRFNRNPIWKARIVPGPAAYTYTLIEE